MKKNVAQRGLTLIELIVVIVIIGVLAGVLLAVINPGGRAAQARDAKIKADVARLVVAIEASNASNEAYPADLNVLTTSGELKTLPKQPGSTNDYRYQRSADGLKASLYAPMQQNKTKIWCWRSETNTATDVNIIGSSVADSDCTP